MEELCVLAALSVSGSLTWASGAPWLDLRSCGGEGLGESDGSLLEGGARVADWDGYEYHLPP